MLKISTFSLFLDNTNTD